MWIAVGLVVIIGLILLAAWAIDRRAAKRGVKIHIRHTGLRRQVTFTRIDETDGEPSDH